VQHWPMAAGNARWPLRGRRGRHRHAGRARTHVHTCTEQKFGDGFRYLRHTKNGFELGRLRANDGKEWHLLISISHIETSFAGTG
jgi:hypothetical protein